MISDFIRFVHEYNKPQYQLERFRSFLLCLKANKNTTPTSGSYINVRSLFQLVVRKPGNIISLAKRLSGVINSTEKLLCVYRALRLTMGTPQARLSYFYFWLFNWSNSVLKYGDLSEKDFDIDSLGRPAKLSDVVPDGYQDAYFEPIPDTKIRAQRQSTIKTLTKAFVNAE